MDKYISIAEASTKYGKSVSSIRRIVKELKESDLSKLEFHKLKNGTEKILISSDHLNKCFSEPKESKSNSSSVDLSSDLVTFLKEQILAKDELIKNLTQLLAMEKQQTQMLLDAPKKKKGWFLWSRKD
jgi:hypothetical protein